MRTLAQCREIILSDPDVMKHKPTDVTIDIYVALLFMKSLSPSIGIALPIANSTTDVIKTFADIADGANVTYKQLMDFIEANTNYPIFSLSKDDLTVAVHQWLEAKKTYVVENPHPQA